ncbi:MAG: FAD-dependent oxidoreductase [Gammaproteobacteria bacterium]|nr:FAD-dependent oxidoreductase [Gammaproteobacteria bacterium]
MTAQNNKIARRDFLTSIGKAVGGSAMLRAMAAMGIASGASACGSSSAASVPAAPPPPPPPPSGIAQARPGDWPANVGSGRSVLILGAGISGMTAAWEMRKLGYTCTILEAQASAGGRNKTIRSGDTIDEIDSSQTCLFDVADDLYLNAGPSRIAHHHEFLLGYCREFGIDLETFTNSNHGAWMHSTSTFGGQPQIAKQIFTDTRGNIARLLATAINQNALDQELSATDKSNILQMLGTFGDLDTGSGYAGSSRAGFPGQMNAGSRRRGERVTPLQLQELIADTFWELRASFSQGFEQQPTMLQPTGGMDKIARAFESRVLAETVFEAQVSEIRKTASGTRVVYSDRFGTPTTIDTDFCIVTIPATVLASIANDFSAAHQAEIAGFNYTSAVRAGFQSRRFWEQDHNIYGGISWTDQEITQIWYPNYGFGKTDGIILGAYIFGGVSGDNFANLSPAQRIGSIQSQANNVHPEFNAEASRGISIAWRKMPFQLGGWGTSNPATLLTPDANIVFAGEHLSMLQGWQEGAILSAYHAIDQVVMLS